ncbi:ABC transporter permease subunit [Cellulomonas wangsupingiae]|uniref:ABC transporter permease subunit n=1 Tax=Cellulomonas wangsupingiae TaxID=2968085 RepID=UPI001D0F27D8|nr:ABC transporter permease subunit [Cellulomonas wangsupingiae]MCM0640034.1 hypothetical protein [Cellulomonas wangsupingiae]
MSAATTAPQAPKVAPSTRSGPTFGRVLTAEWTKIVSLRSPWWIAAVTVAVAGLLTYVSAQASSVDPGFRPVGDLSSGLLLAQLGPLVLGVLVGAGEFRTGVFRTTYTVVPRRWPALTAQTLALAAFALVVAVLTTVVCVLGLLPSAGARGIPLDLASGHTPGILLGMVLLLVGLALFGQAIGALLRRTVPAMVTALFLAVLLPFSVMSAFPAAPTVPGEAAPDTSVAGMIAVLSPGAAQTMVVEPSVANMAGDGVPDLSQVDGGLVLAAWILVLLAAAVLRLRTRDVR